MSPDGTLVTIDGRAALRFEGRYPHDIERVWRAVTDPAEMSVWFPSDVLGERAVGAELLFDDELRASCAAASRQLGETLRWSQVLRPLVEFCREPRRAPDLVDPHQVRLAASTSVVITKGGGRLRQDLELLREYHREGGWPNVWANATKRLRRLAGAVARRLGAANR